MTARPRLPFYLAGVYTTLILYGSLYPFSGWRDTGIDPFAFLEAGWPRYYTLFDLGVNAAAYVPLGFFWMAVLAARLPAMAAVALAALLAAGLSLGVEYVQNYLPSRIPANLDFACNTLGGVLGALAGLRWGRDLLDGGRLLAWRERRFLSGAAGDRGLVLIALWLLAQLNPESFLFGNGNLRGLIGLPAAFDFRASHFLELEMATVAAQTLAVALLGNRLASKQPLLFPMILLVAAMLVKSAALVLLMESATGFAWGFAWITPGTLGGLALGLTLALLSLGCQADERLAIAAMALMLATVLANLMPDNPYLEDTLRVWQQGHFLNFNGLTRLVAALWPFLALPWLMLSRTKP